MAKEFRTYFKEDIPKKVKNTQADHVKALKARTAKTMMAKKKEGMPQAEKFYKDIHKMFDYTCQETSNKLQFDHKQVAHLLPKSKYEHYRFDTRNAILLSLDIHHILDEGSRHQRLALKCWNRIARMRTTLLEEAGLEYDESFWLNSKF